MNTGKRFESAIETLRDGSGDRREASTDAVDPEGTFGSTPSKDELIDDTSPDVAPDGSLVGGDSDEEGSDGGSPAVWQTLKIFLFRGKNWVEMLLILGLILAGMVGLYTAYVGASNPLQFGQIELFGVTFGTTTVAGTELTSRETMIVSGIATTAVSWYLAHRLTRGSPATF